MAFLKRSQGGRHYRPKADLAEIASEKGKVYSSSMHRVCKHKGTTERNHVVPNKTRDLRDFIIPLAVIFLVRINHAIISREENDFCNLSRLHPTLPLSIPITRAHYARLILNIQRRRSFPVTRYVPFSSAFRSLVAG